MKKKILLIIFLAILIAILFIIPKDTYKKIFGKHDDEVINVEDYEKIFVYMNNEDDKLIGVNAYVYSLEEDLIRQKFDVLTMQTGIFNEDYDTTINTFTKLIDYNIEGNVLELNLSSEFLNSESRNTIEQLVWTYCDDEISELRVSVENEPKDGAIVLISGGLWLLLVLISYWTIKVFTNISRKATAIYQLLEEHKKIK